MLHTSAFFNVHWRGSGIMSHLTYQVHSRCRCRCQLSCSPLFGGTPCADVFIIMDLESQKHFRKWVQVTSDLFLKKGHVMPHGPRYFGGSSFFMYCSCSSYSSGSTLVPNLRSYWTLQACFTASPSLPSIGRWQ